MSKSSSGVVSSAPKSRSSRSPELGGPTSPPAWASRRRLSAERSLDSGIAATPLPSSCFGYLSWNQLEESELHGNQLTCPRVREGPPREEIPCKGQGDTHGDARRTQRRRGERGSWEKRLQENWENCVELNLSFQDLGDPYQLENFCRILRRLIRVERLQLVDNALRDLSSIRLPRCRSLNLHRNRLTSIRQLPAMPRIQHLCLSENAIGSLGELALLGAAPLQSLTLRRNPCAFLEDYRARVFSCLPELRVLDGIPKLPEDSARGEAPVSSRTCAIL